MSKRSLCQNKTQYNTWNVSKKEFSKRKQGAIVPGTDVRKTDELGRVYTIHPNNAECYFLRLLLHTVRGPTSFASLRTIDGEECHTFREACQKYGLLKEDTHWATTMSDAAAQCSPQQFRSLFAIILTTCAPSVPTQLWVAHKDSLSEDFLRQSRQLNNNPDLQIYRNTYNLALIDIEDKCPSIFNKSLEQWGLEKPTRNHNQELDQDILRETSYDFE